MTIKIKFISILFLSILITACNNREIPKDFDYGRVEKNKYLNSYFDFEMSLPKDWKVQSKEQMADMTKKGKELIAGNDTKLKEAIKASDVNSASLLSVFQFHRDSVIEYNPSFSVVVENIKNIPGIKTGNEYLNQARKLMEKSQLKYDYIDSEFPKEIINESDFYKMDAKINYLGLNIKQTYYVTIRRGFAFVVITSFINDQQKKDILNSVNSMKFKN